MKKSLVIYLLLFLPCLILPAQDPRVIKENPSYIWGEASGNDYESAQAKALDALIAKLAASDILLLPSRSRISVWNSYRTDIISASDVIGNNGSMLRYMTWKDVGRIFSRRKNLVNELSARARRKISSGRNGEAATCLEWALTLLEALPEDKDLEAQLQTARNALGTVNPVDIPSLSYIGREVALIRSALRSGIPKAKPATPKLPLKPEEKETRTHAIQKLPPVVFPEGHANSTYYTEHQLIPREIEPTAIIGEEPGTSPRQTLIALAQCSANPQVQPGILLGTKYGKVGGYVSFRKSLSIIDEEYSCLSDGSTDYGYIWTSGLSKRSGYGFSAGILLGVNSWLSAYAGAGYGNSLLFWEDVSGQWARVLDKSFKGPVVEGGFVMCAGQDGRPCRIAFITGLSTISFRTVSPTVGIGLSF